MAAEMGLPRLVNWTPLSTDRTLCLSHRSRTVSLCHCTSDTALAWSALCTIMHSRSPLLDAQLVAISGIQHRSHLTRVYVPSAHCQQHHQQPLIQRGGHVCKAHSRQRRRERTGAKFLQEACQVLHLPRLLDGAVHSSGPLGRRTESGQVPSSIELGGYGVNSL